MSDKLIGKKRVRIKDKKSLGKLSKDANNPQEKYKKDIEEMNDKINKIIKDIEDYNKKNNTYYKLNIKKIKITKDVLKRSSFKEIKESKSEMNKKLYTDLIKLIKDENQKKLLEDYNNAIPCPTNKSYWPSIKQYLFIKIKNDDIKENIDEEIKKIYKGSNKFIGYTYIIYKLELINEKKVYVHYLLINNKDQQSIITKRFVDWELVELNNKNNDIKLIEIRIGSYAKNCIHRYYFYYNNFYTDFEKDIKKDILNLNIELNRRIFEKKDINLEIIKAENIHIENNENIENKKISKDIFNN